MKRILITGANSYIGENFRKYCNDIYKISVMKTRNLSPDPKMFVGYDVVFHVAGIAHIRETKNNRKMYFEINRNLTLKIAEAAKNAGVKQFVVLSSMSVYGKENGIITKKDIPQPISAYGKSKYQADIKLQEMQNETFKIAILRPPMVYGKDCKGNYQLLRKFALVSPIFPNYKNKRSMIYVGNLCEFIKIVIDKEMKGIFFPQNSEYVCTSEMVKLIAGQNGKKIVQISIFNIFIKFVPLAIVKKVFGDLVYEKTDIIDEFSFEESIRLSEGK